MQCHNIFRVRWLRQANEKIYRANQYFLFHNVTDFLEKLHSGDRHYDFFKGTPTLLSAAHDTLTLEEVPLTSTDRKCVMFILKLLVEPAIDHLIMPSSIYKHS